MENSRTKIPKVQVLVPPRTGHVLLNPGPCNVSSRVKSALLHDDICHRDPEYSELMQRLSGKLRQVFRASREHTAVILTGSGTAASECAIASCVPDGGKILVIDNGAFGERLAEIAQLHDLDVLHLRYAYGQPVRVEDVREALATHPGVNAVAMVHHETSVGLLNPVREIGALCREHDCLFLVDAVSSLGAEDLDVVRDRIDVCWSSSNKCLHAVSGLSFVCVHPRVWIKIAGIKPRVYYLDLKRYRDYLVGRSQTPFTPAVTACFALEAALDEYLEDGAARRQALYRARNRKLREGLARLGLDSFTNTGNESHSIMTVTLPEGLPFDELYRRLKSGGFVIYDCKPPLQGRYFQVANMGELTDADLDGFLAALSAIVGPRRPADAARQVTPRLAAC